MLVLVNAAYDFLTARFLPSERDRTTEKIERQAHRFAELKVSYDKVVTESVGHELRADLYDIAVLVDLHYAA